MTPILRGGQGRAPRDLRECAQLIQFFLLAATLTALACAIVGSAGGAS